MLAYALLSVKYLACKILRPQDTVVQSFSLAIYSTYVDPQNIVVTKCSVNHLACKLLRPQEVVVHKVLLNNVFNICSATEQCNQMFVWQVFGMYNLEDRANCSPEISLNPISKNFDQ